MRKGAIGSGRTLLAVIACMLLAGGGLVLTNPGRVSIDRRPDRVEFDTDVKVPPVTSAVALGDDLYLIAGGGGNTGLFLTGHGAVLVDPKYAVSWPALEAEIRAITALPITHVILTHFHNDHTESVALLPPSVKVVAHEHAIEELVFNRYVPDDAVATGRAVPYRDRMTLFDGDDRISLYWPGPLHTAGDTIVSFDRARVLQVGDVFPGKVFPVISVEGGGDGTRYPEGVQGILDAFPDATRLITGHGAVMSRDDLAEFGDFMAVTSGYVRREMGMFRDKHAIFKALVLPARFAAYDRRRQFDTLDEIDRSYRPRWQRVF